MTGTSGEKAKSGTSGTPNLKILNCTLTLPYRLWLWLVLWSVIVLMNTCGCSIEDYMGCDTKAKKTHQANIKELADHLELVTLHQLLLDQKFVPDYSRVFCACMISAAINSLYSSFKRRNRNKDILNLVYACCLRCCLYVCSTNVCMSLSETE